MSTDEYVWTDEDARRFTAPCVDRWQWDAWLAAHDARVKRDAAREALDGLAEQEARACDRGDLTPDALHIHASMLACVEMYARDHYPEETP